MGAAWIPHVTNRAAQKYDVAPSAFRSNVSVSRLLIIWHKSWRVLLGHRGETEVRQSFIRQHKRTHNFSTLAASLFYIIPFKKLRTSKQRERSVTCLVLLCRDARHVGFSTLLATRLTLGNFDGGKHRLFWQPGRVHLRGWSQENKSCSPAVPAQFTCSTA